MITIYYYLLLRSIVVKVDHVYFSWGTNKDSSNCDVHTHFLVRNETVLTKKSPKENTGKKDPFIKLQNRFFNTSNIQVNM